MFKNMLVYRFEEPIKLDIDAIEAALKNKPLQSCLTQELESIGWQPVFKEGNMYVEKLNNALFIRLGIEQKLLPNSVIRTAVDKHIEEKEIKHISRSELKELYERVMNKLLPNALVTRHSILAYIDLEKNHLVVDASSTKKASILTSHLRKTLGSLPIIPCVPDTSVAATMTQWAMHGINSDQLSLLYNIELKELKDEGGNAKFKGVPIDSKETQEPLKEGWQAVSVSLSYNELIAFKLDGSFILKNISYLDGFRENLDDEDDPLLAQQAAMYLMVDSLRRAFSELLRLSNQPY